MAKKLSKSGIASLGTIRPWHVSQSVDALTGADDYDISISGSLTVTGSIAVSSSLGSLSEIGVADSSGLTSINFSNRRLKDTNGVNVIDWQTGLIKDGSNINSLHWGTRNLIDASNNKSIDWTGRRLLQSDGSTTTIDWENQIFTGSLHGTASWAENVESASYALTASYVDMAIESASYALTASYAVSASYEIIKEVSSSHADTASYVNPLVQNVIITGSVDVLNGNVNITSNANFFQGTSTGGSNVSLIGVNSSDSIYIGNQGYNNILADDTIISGSLIVSSSSNQQLTVIGSGSSNPIFTVQGSLGELFSITDNFSGSLFSVNNISGFPILEVFSDNTILHGDSLSPSLNTTVKNTVSSAGAFTVYELPTASYDGAFFEYTARSGSNARAGQIMSIWSGSQVNFTETATTDFGDTSGLAFTMIVTGSNFALTGSAATANWTVKTIVRSI